MSDLTEVEQLKLQLTEAEATRLNLEWKLGEAEAALTEARAGRTRAEIVEAPLREENRRLHGELAWLRGQVQTLRGLCDALQRVPGYDPIEASVTVRAIREIIDMKPPRAVNDAAPVEVGASGARVEVAECGCPITRKQAVITTHTRACSTAQQVASFAAHMHDEYGVDADDEQDDELSTPEIGPVTPQMLADVAFVESIGNPDCSIPLDDDDDLADINARVAADKRVLDAAEVWSRMWGPDCKELSVVYHEPGTRELFAATLARRSAHGGQTEVNDEKRAEVEAELFRAGIVPGACPACRSTASAHLCSTDEVAVELETLQHLTRRRDGDDV